jgi:hypothetical protein
MDVGELLGDVGDVGDVWNFFSLSSGMCNLSCQLLSLLTLLFMFYLLNANHHLRFSKSLPTRIFFSFLHLLKVRVVFSIGVSDEWRWRAPISSHQSTSF